MFRTGLKSKSPTVRKATAISLIALSAGSLYLLSRPEAALPEGDNSDFYPNWPMPARRFINGGLYRGLVGALYDLGVRDLRVGVHSVAEARRQIMETRSGEIEKGR